MRKFRVCGELVDSGDQMQSDANVYDFCLCKGAVFAPSKGGSREHLGGGLAGKWTVMLKDAPSIREIFAGCEADGIGRARGIVSASGLRRDNLSRIDHYPCLSKCPRGAVIIEDGRAGLRRAMISAAMRYTYLGGRGTRPELIGVQCDPVRRADGRCIVSQRMATALVQLASGEKHIVLRRRLRLNSKQNTKR